jgi:hypothetical protein
VETYRLPGTLEGRKMDKPHIRIFPHDPDQFPTIHKLTTWLLGQLCDRGGLYRVRRNSKVSGVPTGSVALFRYGNYIVGEAIVAEELRPLTIEHQALRGVDDGYDRVITFAPSSVRLYDPALPVNCIRTEKNLMTYAGAYAHFEDWSIYPEILAAVVKEGRFVQ